MATINPTVTRNGDQSVMYFTYETLTTTDDTGAAIEFDAFADRSIQVTGTFGSGGTIVWQGSNDGTNYVTMSEPDGTAISLTAAGLKSVLEITKFARPFVSAGDGSTDLDVTVVCRRQSSMRT